MNNENISLEIEKLEREKELVEKSLKHYSEEMKRRRKEKAFSLFGREDSIDVGYIKGEIERCESELNEINRRLRIFYNESGKRATSTAMATATKRITATANEKGTGIVESLGRKKLIFLILSQVAIFVLVVFYIADSTGYDDSIGYNGEITERKIDKNYDAIVSDLDEILSKYDFKDAGAFRDGSESDLYSLGIIIYKDVGETDEADEGNGSYIERPYSELELTISKSEKTVRLLTSTADRDPNTPMKIENEDIKLLMCDVLAYICDEDVIAAKDIDRFLREIPEENYLPGGSYREKLSNYNPLLTGTLEYTGYQSQYSKSGNFDDYILEKYLLDTYPSAEDTGMFKRYDILELKVKGHTVRYYLRNLF